MRKIGSLGRMMTCCVALCLLGGGMAPSLEACTSLMLKAKNGDVVYGRTQEWGSFEIFSRLVFYPRKYSYVSKMTGDRLGHRWQGRYGMVGIDGLYKGFLIDGMNEAGLTAGLLYHPGFASYVEVSEQNVQRAIRSTDVLNYVLSTCATVEEVRQAVQRVVLVNVPEEALGFAAPVHIVVTEPNGEQLVVEWHNSVPTCYQSEVGVLTNAPNYDWHLVNLRNYLHLSNRPQHDVRVSSVKMAPLGGGSGLLGMPGDFTPPSRFVRAVALKSIARPLPNGAEGIYEMFRILDNFNVPLGEAEGDGKKQTGKLRSSTVWTVAYDLTERQLFYHTHNDRQVQMVDLSKLNFKSFDRVVTLPLDEGRQSIKNRTPKELQ